MAIEGGAAGAEGRRLRLGMVGGGQGAFIGGVHRIAARLDDRYELVAGALSAIPTARWRALPNSISHLSGLTAASRKWPRRRRSGLTASTSSLW